MFVNFNIIEPNRRIFSRVRPVATRHQTMKTVLILTTLNLIGVMTYHLFNIEENYEKLMFKTGANKVFHKYDSDFFYVGSILHIKLGKDYQGLDKRSAEYENEFRGLLAMKHFQYDYKRGEFWRTWREVRQGNRMKVIHYKCSGERDPFCKDCHDKGFWAIERQPPECQYEINYIVDEDKYCLATLSDASVHTDACPVPAGKRTLLEHCDNPILTSWKFRRNHDAKSKNNRGRKWNISDSTTTYISGRRDSFDIKTHYLINQEEVVFRIINTTNEIIFSKVMKPDNVTYICLDDCGIYNANTRLITTDLKNGNQSAHLHRLEKSRSREKVLDPKYRSPVDKNQLL